MRSIRQRRLQAKTDYKARFGLLKSGQPRLVIRKTNKYILAQLVISKNAQDTVMASASSQELLAKGWPTKNKGSLKSLPAAYLTGVLIAKKVKKQITNAIVDFGMQRNIHKSRLYAVVQGAIESGLTLPHNQSVLPIEHLENHPLKQNLTLKEKI
jgi:large subunit ribosomal protein L18